MQLCSLVWEVKGKRQLEDKGKLRSPSHLVVKNERVIVQGKK